MYPLEGDIVESHEGLFFEVKGFDHPSNAIIGFVRYAPIFVPDPKGSGFSATEGQLGPNFTIRRPSAEGNSTRVCHDAVNSALKPSKAYYKIEQLKDKFTFIRHYYPQYLYSSSNHYFDLQSIPHSAVKRHLSPSACLHELSHKVSNERPQSTLTPLERDAYALCQALHHGSGISFDSMGITGSILAGMAAPDSDLDLVVYGYQNGLAVRDFLRRQNSFTADTQYRADFRPYSAADYQSLYVRRASGTALTFSQFLAYEGRKLHQGKFRSRDYFIRFLDFDSREEYARANAFDRHRILALGRLEISGTIAGDEHWWATPMRVIPSNVAILGFWPNLQQRPKSLPAVSPVTADVLLQRYRLSLESIAQIISLRGRHTENVRLLDRFRCLGTLELVIPASDDICGEKSGQGLGRSDSPVPPYLQLSLGSRSADFLYPI